MQPERRRNLLLFLVTVPFWTNLLVRVYAWILLLRNGGLVDAGLQGIGLTDTGLGLLYTDNAVIIGLLYTYLPFMVLPIYSSLEKMDWRLVEAAFDLGANRWKALRRVIVPLAMPGIVAGCILVFIPALGSYIIPELLGGGKALMIGNLIQLQFGTAHNWPFGAALSFALLAFVLLAMLIYNLRFRAQRRRRPAMNGRNPLWTFSGVRQAAWLFFAFLYIPILVLVVLSFNSGQSATLWESFSLKWYAVVANDPEILRAAKNSLLVATLATLASTVLATLAALGMRGRAFRGQTLMNGVLGLPLLVPEIVTAVATLMFFSFIGLKLSLFTILIAHVVFCIPFAYLPIRARLEGLDPRLAEAAADLYASPWKAFWKITLPLLMPGVLSGAMLAFIISMDDFVITYFVAGAGATTLPVYIFSSIRMGISPKINAISSIILMISIAFVALSYYLGQRRR